MYDESPQTNTSTHTNPSAQSTLASHIDIPVLSYMPPEPDVIETLSFDALVDARKAQFLALAQTHYQAQGETEKYAELVQVLALASEPIVKLIEENAYRELLLRQRINEAARSVMLPYATGADLDNLGALYAVSRDQLDDGTAETDAAYRKRLLLAPKSFSTAGSEAAYQFHALSAGRQAQHIDISAPNAHELHIIYRYSPDHAQGIVKDAHIASPAPCDIQVTVLGFDAYGEIEPQDMTHIREHLSDARIRPLGDRVHVQSAAIILYDWAIQLHVSPTLEGSLDIEEIRLRVLTRLHDFVRQHHRLGKAIRRSTLLGSISGLFDGWVSMQWMQNGEPLTDEQDILVEAHQAAHLNLGNTDDSLDWCARIQQALTQSLTVVFDD